MKRINSYLLFVSMLLLGLSVLIPQSAEAATPLLPSESTWRYYDLGNEPPALAGNEWYETVYNDTAWSLGSGVLGYGDTPDTPLNTVATAYFRHTFTVFSSASVNTLHLQLLRDDGAVVYLNGVELVRDNLPSGAIDYTTPANTDITGIAESNYVSYFVAADQVVVGDNVIAVEVHQRAGDTNDMLFDLAIAGLNLVGELQSLSFQNGLMPSGNYAGTDDTTLDQNTPNSNYGASASLCLVDGDTPAGSGFDQTLLLYWSVDMLPDDAVIHAAQITMEVTSPTNDRIGYQFYELKRDWQEATATWNQFDANNVWQLPGARGVLDRGFTALGKSVPFDHGAYTVNLNPAGVDLVQEWVNADNNGILLTNIVVTDGVDFECSEAAVAENRPKLTIYYTSPTTGDFVDFVWSGSITPDSARVVAKLTEPSNSVRLVVSENAEFSNRHYSAYQSTDADNLVSLPISGLDDDTHYHYAVEVDGILDVIHSGTFRTFPVGARSFEFVISADADTGSNAPVFNTIEQLDPLFFLNLGDLHYSDIDSNDIELFQAAYETVLDAPKQANLYRSVPFVHVWDDHDYGPNNSDATAPGREAARLTFQQYVPHYPLAAGVGDVPIYQAFTAGRVRFIMTDLRSERTPNSATDNASKSMLGTTQKAWLKQELLLANGIYPLILWVNTVPWIAEEEAGADHWGGFTTEREEIAEFIEDNEIEGVVILSGDAHMLAVDDGSNNDYASDDAEFPVLHASALNRGGSVKGGPYSHGTFPNPVRTDGQYAHITIEDGGSSICLRYSGQRLETDTSNVVEVLFYRYCPSSIPTSVQVSNNHVESASSLIAVGLVIGVFVVLMLIKVWQATLQHSRNKMTSI